MTRRMVVRPTIVIALLLPGCTTWKTVPGPPGPRFEEERAGQARIVRRDGSRVDVREPWVEGDLIGGLVRVPLETGALRTDTVRVALNDVARVQVRRVSFWRTTGLIAGAGLAYAIGWVVWFAANYEN